MSHPYSPEKRRSFTDEELKAIAEIGKISNNKPDQPRPWDPEKRRPFTTEELKAYAATGEIPGEHRSPTEKRYPGLPTENPPVLPEGRSPKDMARRISEKTKRHIAMFLMRIRVLPDLPDRLGVEEMFTFFKDVEQIEETIAILEQEPSEVTPGDSF